MPATSPIGNITDVSRRLSNSKPSPSNKRSVDGARKVGHPVLTLSPNDPDESPAPSDAPNDMDIANGRPSTEGVAVSHVDPSSNDGAVAASSCQPPSAFKDAPVNDGAIDEAIECTMQDDLNEFVEFVVDAMDVAVDDSAVTGETDVDRISRGAIDHVEGEKTPAKSKLKKQMAQQLFNSRKIRADLGRKFMIFLRPDTFNSERFKKRKKVKKGEAPIVPEYSRSDMMGFDAAFQSQLLFNFDEKRGRKKSSETRGSRSKNDDLDSEMRGSGMETCQRKELSRYVIEDVLRRDISDVGTQFLVLIKKSAVDDLNIGVVAEELAEQQHLSGIAGDTIRISGQQYWCLKGEIAHYPLLGEVDLDMSRKRLLNLIDDSSGGFRLHFDGTDDGKLFVPWNWLVRHPTDVLLFGHPLEGTRRFDPIFRKKSIEFSHHIFRQFSTEYRGDGRASAQLYAAYQKRQAEVLEKEVQVLKSAKKGVLSTASFDTEETSTICAALRS